MHGVDLYRRVRLACHREGLSRREASRQFGIDRKTVAKILLHSEPPGYRRRQPPKRPKLAPFTDIIDGILEEDRTVHRKQRHTAKRIFERLRDEHGFTGKLDDREGLRSRTAPWPAGDVRAAGAPSGSCPGGLWRGGCDHCRRHASRAFFRHDASSQRCLLCCGLPGGDGGGLAGRAQCGLCLLRRGSPIDSSSE